VADTSVLMSQHRHELWLRAHAGQFAGIWSTFIVAELVRVWVRRSIARGVQYAVYRERINRLVHTFSDVLEVADYRRAEIGSVLPDSDDEPSWPPQSPGAQTRSCPSTRVTSRQIEPRWAYGS
jgi:hypothetical protein